MSSRIFIDSTAVELSRKLESAILGERREELLWKATQDRQHLEQRDIELHESENIVNELHNHTTSQEETLLLMEVKKKLGHLVAVTKQGTDLPIREITPMVDSLLQAVADYSEVNRTQIEETMEASRNLNVLVDTVTLLLILFVAVLCFIGSLVLVTRIVKPITLLRNTVEKFAAGDLSVRIPINAEDELGVLCKTFNNMAASIAALEKDRFNFFASVAHDLKNPLIVIGGAARRIQKGTINTPEGSRWLQCIIEQIAYLESLIHDLMDSIQIERGKLKLNIGEVELSSLLHSLQQNYNETVDTHQIIFNKEKECRVNCDAMRLERVFANLISNAVKYSPIGSTILIKATKSGNDAVITISDEGSGISLNDSARLFQPFERLERTEAKITGTGLGLYSAKTIVELHGGAINIYGNAAKGTTVEITLPVRAYRGMNA